MLTKIIIEKMSTKKMVWREISNNLIDLVIYNPMINKNVVCAVSKSTTFKNLIIIDLLKSYHITYPKDVTEDSSIL